MATRSLGSLTLDLILKLGGFTQGMDQAARVAERRTRQIDRAFRGLRRTVAGFLGGFTVVATVRAIVQATTEQENALKQLEQGLKTTGGAAGRTSRELVQLANDLQKVTTFSDDAIVQMQSLLVAFTNIRGDVFERTTEAALDLATALGQDLPAAAKLLGLALNNPITGLSRLARAGVSLDQDQQNLIKRLAESGRVIEAQNLLLDELTKRFGGRARAAADTFGGSIQQLKNAFSDLLEGQGGVADAKQEIQELTRTLQDPKIKEGLQSLIALTFQALGNLAKLFSDIGTGLRILAGGASELEKLDNQIELLQRKLRGEGFGDIPGVLNLGFIEDAPVFIAGSRALQREIDRLIAKRNELTAAFLAPTTGVVGEATPGFSGVLPPSEKFLEIEASLKEQIALLGKTGEAAKLAFQIQSGALDELSEAERQQVLQLARRYDALVKVNEATKKLKDAFDSQVSNYQREIALLDAVTEADKLRFETTSGNLKGLTEAQKAYLLEFARQIDQAAVAKSLEDINLQILELRGNTAEAIALRFDIQNRDLLQSLEQLDDDAGRAQLANLRQLTIEQGTFNELREEYARITADLALQEERIRNSQEVGAATELEALGKIGDARKDSIRDLEEIVRQLEALAAASTNPDLVIGARQLRAELEKLRAEANLLEQKIEGELKEAGSSFFFDLASGAKSAGDAIRSFIDDIHRRFLNLIAQNFAEKLFGGFFGKSGALGNVIGSIFGIGPPRAGGGPAYAGWVHPVNEIEPEYFRSNVSGEIIPLSKMRGAGMTVNQYFSVSTPTGQLSRPTQQQLAAAAARGIADANRRNN